MRVGTLISFLGMHQTHGNRGADIHMKIDDAAGDRVKNNQNERVESLSLADPGSSCLPRRVFRKYFYVFKCF